LASIRRRGHILLDLNQQVLILAQWCGVFSPSFGKRKSSAEKKRKVFSLEIDGL